MAARPDFATDLRAMCKRHYLGTNLAQQAATLNDLQGRSSYLFLQRGRPVLAQSAVVAMGRLGSDRGYTGHVTGIVDPSLMTRC